MSMSGIIPGDYAQSSQDERTPLSLSQLQAYQFGKAPTANALQIEVFGPYTPTKQGVEAILNSIEINLRRIAIDKIAENSLRQAGKMSKEDINFLESTDDKVLVAFPL